MSKIISNVAYRFRIIVCTILSIVCVPVLINEDQYIFVTARDLKPTHYSIWRVLQLILLLRVHFYYISFSVCRCNTQNYES